jgi:hypothetical protein
LIATRTERMGCLGRLVRSAIRPDVSRQPHLIICPIQIILCICENWSQHFLAIGQASAGDHFTMPAVLEDHGLPLVQLKERRRDLIIALMGQHGPISEQQIAEIASIQSAIVAFEAVLDDLDAEAEVALRNRAA